MPTLPFARCSQHVWELRLRHQVDRALLLLRDALRSYRGVVIDDNASVSLLAVWSGNTAEASKERAKSSRTSRGAELLCNLAALLLQAADAFHGLRAVREDKVATEHVQTASLAFQGMQALFAAEAYASQGKVRISRAHYPSPDPRRAADTGRFALLAPSPRSGQARTNCWATLCRLWMASCRRARAWNWSRASGLLPSLRSL